MDANKILKEKARWELHKNAVNYMKQILEAKPHKTTLVRPLTSSLKNHPSKANETCETLQEKQRQTHKWCSSADVPPYMNVPIMVEQQEFIYIYSKQIQDVVWKTFQEWRMIGMEGKWESKKSMQSVQLDNENCSALITLSTLFML